MLAARSNGALVGRILIIGGYGGFGARLSKRLAARGHTLLIAGRTQAKAERFCATLPLARPIVMDRQSDVADVLAREAPDLVIDAAGPFQGSGYEVPRACVTATIPYLDLADGTEFVIGIDALDEDARRAGVAIVSGASSVPALTGAVARKLASGMDRVFNVDIALSAANGATGGRSVIDAILSYVGRPVRVWRGGRWTSVSGWQQLQRRNFVFSVGNGLRGRFVAVADVPDCRLLPPSLPGHPAVTFRAGTEIALHMIALWLASWPVRWGWVGSLRAAQPWLLPLYRATQWFGGERSAMQIAVTGRAGAGPIERTWTVVAEQGHGVEIPTLAAELVAEDILAGRVEPGARTAARLLSFDRFEPLLSKLAVCHEFAERVLRQHLYRRVLGSCYDGLPPAVQHIHDLHCDGGASGQGTVRRGGGFAARLLGAAMRMPPEGTWPLHVHFSERNGVETWTRSFGTHRFRSRLSQSGELLVEQFGPIRFHFDLPAAADGLSMRLKGWSAFGIPMPTFLGPKIAAHETERNGRFQFDVRVDMPLIGHVVSYSGWLAPPREQTAHWPQSGRSDQTDTEPARVPVG